MSRRLREAMANAVQVNRYGFPIKRTPLEDRLNQYSEREEESGCLVWIGTKNHRGYGRMNVATKSFGAHVVAYHVWVGPMDDGLEIDHLCGNRACIEPRHLEAVTHVENIRRSTNPIVPASAQERCKNGHLLPEPEPKRNRRVCRECMRAKTPCPDCGTPIRKKNLTRHRASSVCERSAA